MKYIRLTIFGIFFFANVSGQDKAPGFVTYDIDHFWEAHDKIAGTKDSVLQYNYINTLFIEKGSPGLRAIMQARRYTPKSYIDAINDYPMFWESIRANTYRAKEAAKGIEAGVNKLKVLYPGLKPATVYFTIGALRTNGTTMDSLVLIGAELAMADSNAVTTEFPGFFSYLRGYFDRNTMEGLVFLNVHEFVHTQQKTTIGNDLLGQCVIEGVAEFLAVKAMEQASSLPAMQYGADHAEMVRERFSKEMFSPFFHNWLWNNSSNEFNIRDLGYYVGYAMCEKYYERSTDKQQAIKEMIELDYSNEKELDYFVDRTGYFPRPVDTYRKQFEQNRPVVLGIQPFRNGAKQVTPGLKQVTITFSEAMNKDCTSFEYGPLGEEHLLRIERVTGFSEDGRSLTFEVAPQPGRHYRLLINYGFMTKQGIPLKPYLIDFRTAKK